MLLLLESSRLGGTIVKSRIVACLTGAFRLGSSVTFHSIHIQRYFTVLYCTVVRVYFHLLLLGVLMYC